MRMEVHRLDAGRRADFYKLHSEENGCGWCRCVAWWIGTWEGWGERTTEENHLFRERLFEQGEDDGHLLYVDGVPVGWCQNGPRDRLDKLVRQFARPLEPGTWAITCFQIAPTWRSRGLASFLLVEVLDDLRRRGVRKVEAYPARGDHLPQEDLWTGPEAMYLAAGFRILRDDPKRPVLLLEW